MSRTGWSLLIGLVVLFLAWWGLRLLWWRMTYIVPAFGLGMIVGIGLTLWIGRGRHRR
ncbi:hypothetical protein [Ornithinimicrobium ciconiae]|uniref:hypothetical protein n=1 Tax=Ornithinimicrobium ciconiae TaxID=2594265 RepID=UPI0013FCF83E|nr:hypothetical protein [Ornithinimicrobium ciconiae]